jgi:outer membrane receptor protein involved in Fe transport
MVPAPCPLLAEVISIHAAALDAAHVHSRSVVTVTAPVPPDAGIVSTELPTVIPQREVDGKVSVVSDEVQESESAANASAANRLAGAVHGWVGELVRFARQPLLMHSRKQVSYPPATASR